MSNPVRAIFANGLLLLLSLVFCLLLAEGGTRLLQAADVVPEFNKETLHKGFREPELTLNGKTVKSDNPVLSHEYDTNDPRINSAGHRGAEFPLQKTPGTTRIAILGDSVAYGYGVPLAETFPMQLQTMLNESGNPVEVLNFAVSGYGSASHLELYTQKVKRYQPDLLLLAYVLNDPLPNNLIVSIVKELMKTARFFEKLSAKTQFGAWVYLKYHNHNDQKKTHRNYHSTFAQQETWVQLQQVLEQLKASNKDRFAVVVFPLLLDYADYPFENIHQRLMDKFDDNDVPALDMLSVYAKQGFQTLQVHEQDNTHPNSLGHRLAAEKLAEFLEQQKLLAP